jgi:hypothetical protein
VPMATAPGGDEESADTRTGTDDETADEAAA